MAGKKVKKGSKDSTKKFGTRYGWTIRSKYAKIERLQKASYACPFCSYPNVTRVAMGIWSCSKCKAKFTSKAYTVSKTPVTGVEEEHVNEEQDEE